MPVINGDPITANFAGTCGIKSERPDDPETGNSQDPLYCSCSLVGPRVVLTAAHCVYDNVEDEATAAEWMDDIDVRFGENLEFETNPTKQFAVEHVELHRYYDDGSLEHNIALLLLDAEPSYPIVTLNETPLDSDDVVSPAPECNPGDPPVADPTISGCATFVGFGETQDDLEDYGSRKKVVTPLISVEKNFLTAGTAEKTSCRGDSGGPVYMYYADSPVQVAVNGGHRGCFASVERLRVDRYVTDFIYPFVDRYGATCGADDNCETSCPRTPDPDCDPCAWTGDPDDCEEDCPHRDWDCDIGSMLGDACEDSGDCEEHGRCVPAADDETFTYCSRPCIPGLENECPQGMLCDTSGTEDECVYVPPSPGSQGFACNCPGGDPSCENSDCRSGICEEEICVVECDPGGDPCPENYVDPDQPYVCMESSVVSGTNVCVGEIRSGGGGFCTPSSVSRSLSWSISEMDSSLYSYSGLQWRASKGHTSTQIPQYMHSE